MEIRGKNSGEGKRGPFDDARFVFLDTILTAEIRHKDGRYGCTRACNSAE
jgi:hypothetical protein